MNVIQIANIVIVIMLCVFTAIFSGIILYLHQTPTAKILGKTNDLPFLELIAWIFFAIISFTLICTGPLIMHSPLSYWLIWLGASVLGIGINKLIRTYIKI